MKFRVHAIISMSDWIEVEADTNVSAVEIAMNEFEATHGPDFEIEIEGSHRVPDTRSTDDE